MKFIYLFVYLFICLLQSSLLQAQSKPPISPENQRILDSLRKIKRDDKNAYVLGSSPKYHVEDSIIVVFLQSIHDDSGQLSDQQKLMLIMDTISKISLRRNISNIKYDPSDFYNKGWGSSTPKADSANKR